MVVLDMCHCNTTVSLQSTMVLLMLFVIVVTGECDKFSVKNVWLCEWTAADEGFSKK